MKNCVFPQLPQTGSSAAEPCTLRDAVFSQNCFTVGSSDHPPQSTGSWHSFSEKKHVTPGRPSSSSVISVILKCKTLGGIHMHHALDLTGCVYAFAGNTCPHGQANLRTCSVASHCRHTFLRCIDIPDCRFCPTDHHAVCFQVHVSSP